MSMVIVLCSVWKVGNARRARTAENCETTLSSSENFCRVVLRQVVICEARGMTSEALERVLASILGVGWPQRSLPIPAVVLCVPASRALASSRRVRRNDMWPTESVLW